MMKNFSTATIITTAYERYNPLDPISVQCNLVSAIRDQLNSLIPYWCEGVDDSYWFSESGQVYAELLWAILHTQAMPVWRAAQKVYHTQFVYRWQLSYVARHCTSYPRPLAKIPTTAKLADNPSRMDRRWYVLLCDVNALVSQRSNLHMFRKQYVYPFHVPVSPLMPINEA
jgi:hypothetical protein